MAPAAWAPKPAVEKLPLSIRKDVRDNFEAKKEDYESTIAGHLGFPVKIEFETNAVAAYADLTTPTLGYYFATYVDGFIYGLTNFAQSYDDIGKEYFKNAVSEAKITLNVNELGDKAPTIDADVKDGVFRILFHHQKFGYNASDLYSLLATAIENAPHDGYSLLAKSSIEKEYNQKVDEAQQQIGEVLNMPDVILDPNFEENYAKLIKKKEKDWVRNYGDSSLKYFQYVADSWYRSLSGKGH
ncbi:hypothetical protein BDN70DRAFT_862444 [Pholiota conissans]|uniref:Uncharacterized protein n=1 Tax=Pholiota conissans TaxID=109636 RepID=A0A9P6CYT4_9AGAR|nr:hypothetical protein BDN70DRAFT_862444 [Pholiota conissans]